MSAAPLATKFAGEVELGHLTSTFSFFFSPDLFLFLKKAYLQQMWVNGLSAVHTYFFSSMQTTFR